MNNLIIRKICSPIQIILDRVHKKRNDIDDVACVEVKPPILII